MTVTKTSHQDTNKDVGAYRRMELITGTVRRRAWSAEERARIVAESFDLVNGPSYSEVMARLTGLIASRIDLVRCVGRSEGVRPKRALTKAPAEHREGRIAINRSNHPGRAPYANSGRPVKSILMRVFTLCRLANGG